MAAEFEVKLARSGRTIPVDAGQSVLDALQAHGVEVATSCQQGVCGTCQTRVLEGEPDHWDMYLTPEELHALHLAQQERRFSAGPLAQPGPFRAHALARLPTMASFIL